MRHFSRPAWRCIHLLGLCMALVKLGNDPLRLTLIAKIWSAFLEFSLSMSSLMLRWLIIRIICCPFLTMILSCLSALLHDAFIQSLSNIILKIHRLCFDQRLHPQLRYLFRFVFILNYQANNCNYPFIFDSYIFTEILNYRFCFILLFYFYY